MPKKEKHYTPLKAEKVEDYSDKAYKVWAHGREFYLPKSLLVGPGGVGEKQAREFYLTFKEFEVPLWFYNKTFGVDRFTSPPDAPKMPVPDNVYVLPELENDAWKLAYKTEPYPYQYKILEHLSGLTAAALFMDMGTGKTKVALDYCASWDVEDRHILVLCPNAIQSVWEAEIKKHYAHKCMVLNFSGNTNRKHMYLLNKAEGDKIVICGVQSLSARLYTGRVFEALRAFVSGHNSAIIVDESHYVKNSEANRTENVLALALNYCERRLILSGTPLTQSIKDLFSQYAILDKEILGYETVAEFERHHVVYNERKDGSRYPISAINVPALTAKVAPYTIQVDKRDVLGFLPQKSFQQYRLPLTKKQTEAYANIRTEMLDKYERGLCGPSIILHLFTLLQQVASGYYREYDYENETFGDIERLVSPAHNPKILQLLELVQANTVTQFVVFFKYKQELNDVAAVLAEAGLGDAFVTFSGDVPAEDRPEKLRQFTAGERRLFLATLQTGGTGINGLQVAHNCIFYSNTFRYSDRIQAEDRLHRIGQHNGVQYIDLYTDTGIDRLISESIARKRGLAEWVRESIGQNFKSILDKI